MTTDLIERFDIEHNAFDNISPERRHDSRRVLGDFERFAAKPLIEAGGVELQSYLATLVADGYAIGTVRKHRNLIRPFYTWAQHASLVDRERLWDVREVKLPRGAGTVSMGVPKPYPRQDVKRLWRDVEAKYPFLPDDYYLKRFANGTSKFHRIQKHAWRLQIDAIVALALFGAMRRDEIFNAQIVDLHHENAYVVVRGAAKNRDAEPKTRIAPWTTPDFRRMIADWLDFRAWLDPPHDGPWLCLYHQPHYLKPLRHRKYKMLLHDLGRGYGFHRLRHTAITEMLRAGYPLREVQQIAGHARIQQTLAYAELLPDDLLKTAARQSSQLSSALSPDLPDKLPEAA